MIALRIYHSANSISIIRNTMRAEIQSMTDEIKQTIGLLRRHL